MRPAPPSLAAGKTLRDRLDDIERTSGPEEALTDALQAIVDAVGAVAAAYCLFDPLKSTLHLAAEVGLSDEGCRNLRKARDGVPIGWDMPLHSLVNRRAYLIESAARNRYVPELVANPGTIGTVACLPVVAGPMRVGTLILVTRTPRVLDESHVNMLTPACDALARLTRALRRRAGDVWSVPGA